MDLCGSSPWAQPGMFWWSQPGGKESPKKTWSRICCGSCSVHHRWGRIWVLAGRGQGVMPVLDFSTHWANSRRETTSIISFQWKFFFFIICIFETAPRGKLGRKTSFQGENPGLSAFETPRFRIWFSPPRYTLFFSLPERWVWLLFCLFPK